MRQYTVPTDGYGDGITDDEAQQMAAAETRAVRRRFPDVSVMDNGDPEDDDPVVHEYIVAVWDRIIALGGNGGPGTDAVVAAWDAE